METWQAEAEKESLELRAKLHELLHRLRGEPNALLPFQKALALRPKGEHHLGLRTIEVDRIVGSVDRYEDFDHRFLPKTPHTLERWKRLRTLQLSGVELPPIEVYQVGGPTSSRTGTTGWPWPRPQGRSTWTRRSSPWRSLCPWSLGTP